jgi:hypothetical protein
MLIGEMRATVTGESKRKVIIDAVGRFERRISKEEK